MSQSYRLDFLLSKQNEWSVKRPSGKMRGDPGGEKIGQKGEMQSKRENGGVTIRGTNNSVTKFCSSRSKFYF